jgi:hypothetical protein
MNIESLNGVYEIIQTSEFEDSEIAARVKAAGIYDYVDTRAVLLNGVLAGVNEGGFAWVFRVSALPDGNVHVTGFVDGTFKKEDAMLISKQGDIGEDRLQYEGRLTLVKSGEEVRLSGRIEHGVVRFNVIVRRVATL